MAKEAETFKRKLGTSPLMESLRANGATLIENDDMPRKQMQQMYRAQKRLHYGSSDEYNTLLGTILKKDREKNSQINALAAEAIKFAPRTIAEHMTEGYDDLDVARGTMDSGKFGERLAPYIWYKDGHNHHGTEWDPTLTDAFVESVKRICNRFEDVSVSGETPLSDYMTWKTQFTSGANSGDPLFESLDKEQWSTHYIPRLMEQARTIADGGAVDGWPNEDSWTRGHYTLFGRTPYRPVHGVSMLSKLVGTKLNFDLSRNMGQGRAKEIAWMPLEQMLERSAEYMAPVESTIHEDFRWFDTYVGSDLLGAVHKGFVESRWFASQPENRNIFEYLLKELMTPTNIRMAPHWLLKMRPSLYSGTPITQIIGCIIHMAYIETMQRDHGLAVTDYMVLSDDGFCCYDGTAAQAQTAMDDLMIPFAERIGMVLNPKKSYIADIRAKKVMYDGEHKIIRHDVGPFLQKYPQLNPDHAFGNVPRLIRSTKGRERDFERDMFQQLYALLPGLRRSERGDRAQMASWVQDFYRTLEVLAQVRPGYPRVRKMIQTYTKIYPGFWKKFDTIVDAADSTGGKLFDTATRRAGGESDKGTTRWLVDYLREARESGSFPAIPVE